MGTVGSVCTGIGGLDRGLHRAGWDLRWACECVAFRRAVIRRHWGTELPVFDDIETLDPRDLEPVDLLAAGTPCPDFSHAKADRRGLAGDQSRLFYEFVRIRDALEPEWTLWENVDGALTTNGGLDFALVLAAFVGAGVDAPRRGWASAGVVAGPRGGAVWRVLDAQHFGTPQRRNRVFVVGRLGGPCPPEVLLEPARRSGHPPPRRQTAKDAARSLGERVAGTLGAYRGRGGLSRSQVIDGHGAYVAAGEPVVIAPDTAETLLANDETDIASALLAAGGRAGAGTTEETVVLLIDGVRRLTPTECERVQGLPDHWTVPRGPSLLDAPAWHELVPAERDRLVVPWDPPSRLDTPRRSACGDAVNAAVAEWIGRRIAGDVSHLEAT